MRVAILLLPFGLGPVLAASCAKSTGNSDFVMPAATTTATGTEGGSTFVPPSQGDSGFFVPISTLTGGDAGDAGAPCNGMPCTDFPAMALNDPNAPVPGNPEQLFGSPDSGTLAGGPCVSEPADGSLYPYNWLRPRVLWTPASTAEKDFEVRIHADAEQNDYVVYTTNNYWAMDKATWQTIAGTVGGTPGTLVGQVITVTVRASTGGGTPTVSNTARFQIAPAIAAGSLIYWTTAAFDTMAMSSNTNTTLQGFRVGDEGTTTALTASQVVQQVRAQDIKNDALDGGFQAVNCIGCHTATPDGNYVAFTSQWPWAAALASVQATSQGAEPPWLTQAAISNLSPNAGMYWGAPEVNQTMMGIQTFSPAHYATGDRIVIANVGSTWNAWDTNVAGAATGVTGQLAWFNLEWPGPAVPPAAGAGIAALGLPVASPCANTLTGVTFNAQEAPCLTAATPNAGWGFITRSGDANSAAAPSWSNNANGVDAIAYSSTNYGIKDGRMDCSEPTLAPTCSSDIYVVPYNSNGPGLGGAGGVSSPLPGASTQANNEYYPAWSPDDAFIAFNRVPQGTSMYDQPKAEVYIVPYKGGNGGTAVRLKANDPVACTGLTSPGVQNTWPKWAPNPVVSSTTGGAGTATDAGPAPQTIDGLTYYWITFSSLRSVTAGAGTSSAYEQLYVAGIVVDASGNVTDYAPIYLWNQADNVNNLIPAWGEFSIPPGVTPPPPPPPPR